MGSSHLLSCPHYNIIPYDVNNLFSFFCGGLGATSGSRCSSLYAPKLMPAYPLCAPPPSTSKIRQAQPSRSRSRRPGPAEKPNQCVDGIPHSLRSFVNPHAVVRLTMDCNHTTGCRRCPTSCVRSVIVCHCVPSGSVRGFRGFWPPNRCISDSSETIPNHKRSPPRILPSEIRCCPRLKSRTSQPIDC